MNQQDSIERLQMDELEKGKFISLHSIWFGAFFFMNRMPGTVKKKHETYKFNN